MIGDGQNVVYTMFEENAKMLDSLSDPTPRKEAGIEIAYNKELTKQIKNMLKSDAFLRRRELLRIQKELEQLNSEEILFEEDYTSRKLESILFRLTNGITPRDYRGSYLDYALNKTIEESGLYLGHIDILKTHEGTEELLSNFFRSSHEDSDVERAYIKSFIRIKEKFPEEVMFFTTGELGIMAFNRLKDKVYFVNVSGKPLTGDGYEMPSFEVLNMM